ncbi:hypothetical protein EDC04DRAFT_2581681 [Pisolithus marmoratus]|nr:hypothetical protein EDC04DRAFT_2581681 [Pisolithus marmoratus]
MLALHSKVPSGHLYVREPHAIQIIQLVEAPPPPRNITSEEECSSYCSSVVPPDESCKDCELVPWTDAGYNTRLKRLHLWRDTVTRDESSSCSSPVKRKLNPHHDDDDNSSHYPSKRSYTASRSSGYMCSACDMPFPSQPSLHQHARTPLASEACRAAVNYHFE